MKHFLLAAMLLPLSAAALAAEPVAFEEDGRIGVRLASGGCRIFFSAARHSAAQSAEQKEPGLSTLHEYCEAGVSTEAETALLEQLFAKAFSMDAFAGDKLIWLERMSAMPFECELLRYASTSSDWPPLLRKLGGKPRLFKEGPPEALQLELAEFIRRAGLLQNLEHIFGARGYRLKRVGVGEVWLHRIDKLNRRQRPCAAEKPVARILPTAELFLVFEREGD